MDSRKEDLPLYSCYSNFKRELRISISLGVNIRCTCPIQLSIEREKIEAWLVPTKLST